MEDLVAFQEIVKHVIDDIGNWPCNENRLNDGQFTNNYYPYPLLFSPIRVNSIEIKNRIVMGPMGNINMASETGRPSQKMIDYFTERARGGTGLITSGLVPFGYGIDPTTSDIKEFGVLPRIGNPRTNLVGWRDIAEACHAYGARFFIQLTPGFGRVGSPECVLTKHRFPISASLNPNWYIPFVPCFPLSSRSVKKLVKRAGDAAFYARSCLIDGVYLHGHEGYLLEQFSNSAYNRRLWGRYKDWQAFGLDLVKEIRLRVGPDYPIHYRIDLSLALQETYGAKMNHKPFKKFQNERKVVQTLNYMENLVKAGVDLFDVDLGTYDNWWLPHPPNAMPPGCFLPISKIVKEYFTQHEVKSNKNLPVPIIAVGKLGYPDLAERALQEGYCDMIMLARPLLADPEWPKKVYEGEVKQICPCIGDHEGCINEFLEGGHIQCSVNPRCGFEDIFPPITTRTPHPKKIAVIGAGPAGIIAACTAAERGHNVTLIEQNGEIGGTLVAGCVPRTKFDLRNYLTYLRTKVEESKTNFNLQVLLNTEASEEFFNLETFDAIISCTGSTPRKLNIDGFELPHVVLAPQFLLNPAVAEDKEKLVVIGGGSVGCEIAHFLAYELLKKDICVIEIQPYFMDGVMTANRWYYIHHLDLKQVKLWNCTKLIKIFPNSVLIERNIHSSVPNPYNTWRPILPKQAYNPYQKKIRSKIEEREIPADLVINAIGMKSNDFLFQKCVQKHLCNEIYNLGDSFSPGKIFEAVKAGYSVGRTI